jgi:hypothetical protein
MNKKTDKKNSTGCACYGVNSIHNCFCTPYQQKKTNKYKPKKKQKP